MNRITALPLLALLSLTASACDAGEEEDDQSTLGDFFENLGEDEEEEDDPYDDECNLFTCAARVTASEIGGLIGLPEDEMAILLDDAGHQPELVDDRLLYTVTAEDIDELALLSATE